MHLITQYIHLFVYILYQIMQTDLNWVDSLFISFISISKSDLCTTHYFTCPDTVKHHLPSSSRLSANGVCSLSAIRQKPETLLQQELDYPLKASLYRQSHCIALSTYCRGVNPPLKEMSVLEENHHKELFKYRNIFCLVM